MHIIPIIFPFHIWEVIWTTYRYNLPPEAEGLSQQDHQTVTIRSQRNRIQHNNCRSLSVWKRQRFSGNIPLTVHKKSSHTPFIPGRSFQTFKPWLQPWAQPNICTQIPFIPFHSRLSNSRTDTRTCYTHGRRTVRRTIYRQRAASPRDTATRNALGPVSRYFARKKSTIE